MNRNEFARNLAAGTYDLIVLDVLRNGPNYGYGIVKRIFEQSKQTIRWHEGGRGGEIKLCGLGKRLKDLFTMTKLIMVFDHHETAEQAIAAFAVAS